MAIKTSFSFAWAGNLLTLQSSYAHGNHSPAPPHNPLPWKGRKIWSTERGPLSPSLRWRDALGHNATTVCRWHSLLRGQPVWQMLEHPQRPGLGFSSPFLCFGVFFNYYLFTFKSQGQTTGSHPLLMDTLYWNTIFCFLDSSHHAAVPWMGIEEVVLFTTHKAAFKTI